MEVSSEIYEKMLGIDKDKAARVKAARDYIMDNWHDPDPEHPDIFIDRDCSINTIAAMNGRAGVSDMRICTRLIVVDGTSIDANWIDILVRQYLAGSSV